jgi:hypothetical protein
MAVGLMCDPIADSRRRSQSRVDCFVESHFAAGWTSPYKWQVLPGQDLFSRQRQKMTVKAVPTPTICTAAKSFRRLIMVNRDRQFIGLPSDVTRWFDDVQSTSRTGTEEEREYLVSTIPENIKRALVDVRLDAICSVPA